ncbi:hypothetical protein, partial [Rhizobium sp. RU36D]|uniref:hypothetical protein n=1 Tax=Rhizobium sp. RU36D TaxID=1907415 RepID=UPI001AECEF2B
TPWRNSLSLIHGMFDHRSGDGGQCGGRTPVTEHYLSQQFIQSTRHLRKDKAAVGAPCLKEASKLSLDNSRLTFGSELPSGNYCRSPARLTDAQIQGTKMASTVAHGRKTEEIKG